MGERTGIHGGGVLTDPFPHLVLDCAFPTPAAPFPPPPDWFGWEVTYRDTSQFNKRTTRYLELLPPDVRALFVTLRSPKMAARLSELFGIPDLQDDPTLHGGGVHVLPPGSRLAGHLDYCLHPRLPGKERRVNAIAFLNREWKEEWGGALCLLDPMGEVVTRVYPHSGRLVVFETSDLSYHAVEPVTGPAERVTAAVYYLVPARPTATRRRALFFPDRG